MAWIAATESRPEPLQDVLVVVCYRELPPVVDVGFWDGKHWRIVDPDTPRINVSHWMQLPALPVDN